MGILGVVWVSKSGLGILIRAPEVPFLVPPKRPKQPKLPIFNTFAFFFNSGDFSGSQEIPEAHCDLKSSFPYAADCVLDVSQVPQPSTSSQLGNLARFVYTRTCTCIGFLPVAGRLLNQHLNLFAFLKSVNQTEEKKTRNLYQFLCVNKWQDSN